MCNTFYVIVFLFRDPRLIVSSLSFNDSECEDLYKFYAFVTGTYRSAFDASYYFFVFQISLVMFFLQTYVSSSSLCVVCDRVVETFCYLVLGFNIEGDINL